MLCKECKSFDSETKMCNKLPSEITDFICLLRHIAWAVNILIQDEDEGEQWKYGV